MENAKNNGLGLSIAALIVAVVSISLAGYMFFTTSSKETANGAAPQSDAAIEAYILGHPEIILESVNKYNVSKQEEQERQTRLKAISSMESITNGEGGLVIGASEEDARITIVEFFDYHCGYCKSSHSELKRIVKDNSDIRFIYKEFPILKEESMTASLAVLAAREQGKYLDLHDAFMRSKGTLDMDRINSIAEKTGVDVAKMQSDMNNKDFQRVLNETYVLTDKLNIDGTPGFIVMAGGEVDVFSGANLNRIKQIIDTGKISSN